MSLAPLAVLAAFVSAGVPQRASFGPSGSLLPSNPAASAAARPAAALPGLRAVAAPAAAVPGARSASIGAGESAAAQDRPVAAALFDGRPWTDVSIESPVDALPIAARRRDGDASAPARVYAGGLALAESFVPYFETQPGARGASYAVWLRAHPPTTWKPTRVVIDADARDLARVIVEAGAATSTGKVELVLHSFGTLVFQRMLQLTAFPEVAAALERLAGSRVVLLNATTHYPGSEREAGPEFERMARATVQFVEGLDFMDDWAALFGKMGSFGRWIAGQFFPWLKHVPEARLDLWPQTRAMMIAAASREAIAMMRRDLQPAWDPSIDPVRARLAEALERHAQDGAWQEALLRRSADMFRLNFTAADVRRLKGLGLRLTLVHAASDALLNWTSARILFSLLGIAAPASAPPAGTVLGLGHAGDWTAVVVDGDHYWPLKRPGELAGLLDK